MTILSYEGSPVEAVYGLLQYNYENTGVINTINLSADIIADISSLGPFEYVPCSAITGVYIDAQLFNPPTLFESALPKLKIGQYNTVLGGFVTGEGFVNYERQQLCKIYTPLFDNTYQYYPNETVYVPPTTGFVNDFIVPTNNQEYLGFLAKAFGDSVYLKFAVTGLYQVIAYYNVLLLDLFSGYKYYSTDL